MVSLLSLPWQLLAHWGIVNAFTGSGESPLQQACLKGTIVSVDFLLSNNVEVNSLNAKKETALHWVVMRKRLPMVEALMKHGADPYFASPGMPTPMEVALADPTMRDIVSAMKSELSRPANGFSHL